MKTSLWFASLLLGCGVPDTHGGGPMPPPPDVDELRFAIVGDTRPPTVDDTASYPTAVITRIWQAVEAESPHPAFAIATGDYQFASPRGGEVRSQLALYQRARAAYAGSLYPALGNHECTGATRSNCGPGNVDGVTANYQAFVDVMLRPIGVDRPYYVVRTSARDASWTAKLVVIACNAWSDAQARWLDGALAEPTTYTFVVRHESELAVASAPCPASSALIAQHPLTLLVVGHTHTYAHYPRDHEIIVGNGGAPLTSSKNFGYVIVARDAGGALTVTAKDYLTGVAMDSFTIDASGAGR